jgi:hypothetical protein
VEAMVEYGQELGVEVGAFSVGTDFSSKMNAILEFGSSIVMLPTFSDFEGEPEHLHKVGGLRVCLHVCTSCTLVFSVQVNACINTRDRRLCCFGESLLKSRVVIVTSYRFTINHDISTHLPYPLAIFRIIR